MDLKASFAVKLFQWLEVFLEILTSGFDRVLVGNDGHGMAQDGHAMIEFYDPLLVHEQQGLPEQGFSQFGGNPYRQFNIFC